jgi:predicted ArsR family transcriptional regulator
MDRRIMGRPRKRYNIRVRGDQREDIDADLLMQALLQIAEERTQGTDASETLDE